MKKIVTMLVCGLLAAMLLVSATGCDSENTKQNKRFKAAVEETKLFQKEIDYNFSFICKNDLVINGETTFVYKTEARKLLSTETVGVSLKDWLTFFDGKIYYLWEYWNDDQKTSLTKFSNIGLFSMNPKTGECNLVKEYKNISHAEHGNAFSFIKESAMEEFGLTEYFPKQAESLFAINGTNYEMKSNTLINLDTGNEIVFNEKYLFDRSETANKIDTIIRNSRNDFSRERFFAHYFNGKIFVYYRLEKLGGMIGYVTTPQYWFEYDIAKDEFKYLTWENGSGIIQRSMLDIYW